MNLRARLYVENQKKEALAKLAARMVFLREKGLDSEAILREATFRQIKALIRKADSRLARIAAQEKLNKERAQAKAEKLAAEKAAPEKARAEVVKEEPEKDEKKGKKEKKQKPAKTEPLPSH